MRHTNYKPTGKTCLFENELKIEKLSKLGNPLEKLLKIVDFEMFRSQLEDALLNKEKDHSKGGARPYDVVLMFKIIVLQQLYNLSDDQMEYQLNDRISFRNFVGLYSGDKVPDAKTIWLYNNNLSKTGAAKVLFDQFSAHLQDRGFYLNAGQMVDASFVEVPKQRNTREENKKIKEGEGDDLWKETPNKNSQKDKDARWTKKGGQNHYGYKDHTKVDVGSKLIKSYVVTDAAVHDSQAVEMLISKTDVGQNFFADSAYVGDTVSNVLKINEMEPQMVERAYRGKPLTEAQKATNKLKSRIRARVEHVYGYMEVGMNKMFSRRIGIVRNRHFIGMRNLVYNMMRLGQLVKYA